MYVEKIFIRGKNMETQYCYYKATTVTAIPPGMMEMIRLHAVLDRTHLVSAAVRGCLSWAPVASRCHCLSLAPQETEAGFEAGIGIVTGERYAIG